jgi:PBSX family phage terminase large subunit
MPSVATVNMMRGRLTRLSALVSDLKSRIPDKSLASSNIVAIRSRITAEALPHQLDLYNSQNKITGLVSGFGAGKTYAACRKAVLLMLDNPGCTGIMLEPTYPLIRDILIPDMMDTLNDIGIKYRYVVQSSTFHITLPDGVKSKILCRSLENWQKLIGVNAAWVIADEFDTAKPEIAYKAYQKLLGRLRAGNKRQFIVTTTPEGFGAAYKIFVKEQSGKLIHARSTDNPYLPDDFVQTLRDLYPPNLLEAYLNGQFVNLTAATVYGYFDRDTCGSNESVKAGDQLYIGLDFNIGACCATVLVRRDDVWHAVDEFAGYDTRDTITIIKDRYPKHHITISPDATACKTTTNATLSDLKLLREARFAIRAQRQNPPVADRVASVNNGFYKRKLKINLTQCPRLTEALEQQAYDDNGRPQKYPDAGSVDDWVDSLGYVWYAYNPVGRQIVKTKLKGL